MLSSESLAQSRAETVRILQGCDPVIQDGWAACYKAQMCSVYEDKRWLLTEGDGFKSLEVGSIHIQGFHLEQSSLLVKASVTYRGETFMFLIGNGITEIIPGKLYATIPSIGVLRRRPGSHSLLINVLFKTQGGDRKPLWGLQMAPNRRDVMEKEA